MVKRVRQSLTLFFERFFAALFLALYSLPHLSYNSVKVCGSLGVAQRF